jgi:hypothetical protein
MADSSSALTGTNLAVALVPVSLLGAAVGGVLGMVFGHGTAGALVGAIGAPAGLVVYDDVRRARDPAGAYDGHGRSRSRVAYARPASVAHPRMRMLTDHERVALQQVGEPGEGPIPDDVFDECVRQGWGFWGPDYWQVTALGRRVKQLDDDARRALAGR